MDKKIISGIFLISIIIITLVLCFYDLISFKTTTFLAIPIISIIFEFNVCLYVSKLAKEIISWIITPMTLIIFLSLYLFDIAYITMISDIIDLLLISFLILVNIYYAKVIKNQTKIMGKRTELSITSELPLPFSFKNTKMSDLFFRPITKVSGKVPTLNIITKGFPRLDDVRRDSKSKGKLKLEKTHEGILYIRLKIKNKGNYMAKGCQVILENIENEEGDKIYGYFPILLNRSNFSPSEFIDINKEVEWYLDFLKIEIQSNLSLLTTVIREVYIVDQFGGEEKKELPEGIYVFSITAYSENTDPKSLRLKLIYTTENFVLTKERNA